MQAYKNEQLARTERAATAQMKKNGKKKDININNRECRHRKSDSVCQPCLECVVSIEVRDGDGDRDDAHLVPLEKCKILSTIMPKVEGTAAPPLAG